MSDLLNQLNNEEKRQAIVDKESCGDYILIDIIGKGGFGVVYKALHKTKGYFSAIKKIKIIKKKKKDRDNGGNDTQSSLMAEINLLKVLSHHNIVRYYDHIPTSSHSYIVMEFIENGSLEKIIKRHGLLPESLVNVYISQVLNGLEYLHRQGVIHRDIKAANLLISTDGSIKLADFGVATKVSDLSSDNPDDAFAGTPYWMAPEVIQMQGISTACDVWSLGCTIIELLTGTPPYFGLAPAAALYKIVQEDHPPIPQGISSALKDFLLNCFKKDENMRSSARQLLIHPWVKSIQLKNPESQVKNARLEILSYNAQLQEAAVETRPRSKFSHPPAPLEGVPIIGSTTSNNSNSNINLSSSNNNLSGPATPRLNNNNNNTNSGNSNNTPITPKNNNNNPIVNNTSNSKTTNTSTIVIPKSQSLENNNNNNNVATSPRVSKQSMTIIGQQQVVGIEHSSSKPQQIVDKEKLKTHLQQYSEKDDDDFGSFNNKPTVALKLEKLNQFVEQDDEELDFGITSLNAKLANNKIWNENEMDGFSDDDDEDQMKKKSVNSNNSNNSNSKNNKMMKLKVKESVAEWDSEIEESFDSMSGWSDNEEIQRNNNIQDKYKEQVIRTIVDFISLLKPNQSNDSLINICTKLTELFSTYPEERRILISNGEGGVYFRLPIITLLEILEQNDIKHVNNNNNNNNSSSISNSDSVSSISSISSTIATVGSVSSISSLTTTNKLIFDENKLELILCLLKLINQSMIDERSVQETICLMNGIPIITGFADKLYPESIREEVSKFVLELCSSSNQSLNMFIAGSRGCRVLVDLLDSDYFTGFSLIHNSLDSISLIFKMNTSTPKTALCHLFAKTQLMYRISYLLNQIFNMSESENSQLSLTQKKKVKCPSLSLSTTGASASSTGISPSKFNQLNGGGSTSMQNLSKDQFDKVISYSVKAADILLFFSTGDSLVKEEMSQEIVIKYIVKVLEEIYTWRVIKHDIRSFLLKILKVIKNLSMDPNIRSRLDNAGVIPCIINYLHCHPGIEKITEIYNQVLHSLYYLLLLDKQRQEKALGAGILSHLLHIIDERGPLKELALPILFDFVRSSTNRVLLWDSNTIDKLLDLIHDRNWFADAIESIAAWAAVESVAVFDALNKNSSNYTTLVSLLSVSHIKHPSFQKSLIPLLYLINGSQPLLKSLIEHGLVSSLTECLDADSSPVSKITLLKITVCITSYIMNHHSTNFNLVAKDQGIALYKVLHNISIQDESEIAKKIADNLVKMLMTLKYY